jgi:hypothetical protein
MENIPGNAIIENNETESVEASQKIKGIEIKSVTEDEIAEENGIESVPGAEIIKATKVENHVAAEIPEANESERVTGTEALNALQQKEFWPALKSPKRTKRKTFLHHDSSSSDQFGELSIPSYLTGKHLHHNSILRI